MATAGPAAVAAVGVTPGPDRGDLFLKLKSTRLLLPRTSTTPTKCMPKFSQAEKAKHWQLGAQEPREGTRRRSYPDLGPDHDPL
jgi:hypothetical protein